MIRLQENIMYLLEHRLLLNKVKDLKKHGNIEGNTSKRVKLDWLKKWLIND